MTRDAWRDAHQVATQKVLDGDLASVRQRLCRRGTLSLALQVLALLMYSVVIVLLLLRTVRAAV